MYQKILVPIAFEDDRDITGSLKLARLLTQENGSITLLHVMERVPGYAISYMPQDYLNEAKAAIKGELKRMADTLPNAEGLVIEGHAGRTILDWANDKSVDLIILASHRPDMGDMLLGSTATTVVRQAQCAIHVIR